jgi:hypothetical protein
MPEGSPIVAVISGNLNPTMRMTPARADSRDHPDLSGTMFPG